VLDHHTSKNHKIFSIKDPIVRKFIHKNLRGGRVQCLKPHFSSFEKLDIENKKILDLNLVDQLIKDKNYLVPFDATSLYPSAMALNLPYPNIATCKLFDPKKETFESLENKKY
jgi:hypothetical protein